MNTLIALGCLKAYLKWSAGWCTQAATQVGQTAVIVGATKHPGYEIAANLAARGCRVIIADYDNLDSVRDKIIMTTHNKKVEYRFVDLYKFGSVHKLAENIRDTIPNLDALIFTDHVCAMGSKPTVDGYRKVLQYNHLAPFLLTYLLQDVLKRNPRSRVIFRSNIMAFLHKIYSPADITKPYMSRIQVLDDFIEYANTSALTLMTMSCFASQLRYYNVLCCAVHPGFTNMSLFDISKHTEGPRFEMLMSLLFGKFIPAFLKLFGKNNLEAAQTTIYVAVTPEERDISGKLFGDCHFIMQPPSVQIYNFSYEIFEETKRLVLKQQSTAEEDVITTIPKSIRVQPEIEPSSIAISISSPKTHSAPPQVTEEIKTTSK